LLGALECLATKWLNVINPDYSKEFAVHSINVTRVKEMSKLLLSGRIKITNLEYKKGRGKGWMWKGSRISIHQLEAFIVYYLFLNKP